MVTLRSGKIVKELSTEENIQRILSKQKITKKDYNFITKQNTEDFCCNYVVSENWLRKLHDLINWTQVSCCQFLTENFMRDYKNDLIWYYISKFQNLSMDFIKEMKNYVHWPNISKYQHLNFEFLKEMNSYLDWPLIFENQPSNITDYFAIEKEMVNSEKETENEYNERMKMNEKINE